MFTFSPTTKAKSAEVNQNFTELSNGSGDTIENSLATYRQDSATDCILSGCIWSLVSGLNGTMTSGVVIVNGLRPIVATIASRAYTVSKDTYVDVDSSGVLYYTEVANGAVSPTLTANRVRMAIVVTSGVTITSVNQLGFDTLNNQIYRTKRIPLQLGAEGSGGCVLTAHLGIVPQWSAAPAGYARGHNPIPDDYDNTGIANIVIKVSSGATETRAFNFFISCNGVNDNYATANWNIASNLTSASFLMTINIDTVIVFAMNSASIRKNKEIATAIRPLSSTSLIYNYAQYFEYRTLRAL